MTNHFRKKRPATSPSARLPNSSTRDMLPYKKPGTSNDAFADVPSWALTDNDRTAEGDLCPHLEVCLMPGGSPS